MAEERKISAYFREIAIDLINNRPELEPLKHSNTTITYLTSEYEKKAKGNLVLGLTEKVPTKNKWAITSDFTITIYLENIKHFTPEQERVLMLHELLHIGVAEDGKAYIKPHDLEDFRTIIDEYGAYWDKPLEVAKP